MKQEESNEDTYLIAERLGSNEALSDVQFHLYMLGETDEMTRDELHRIDALIASEPWASEAERFRETMQLAEKHEKEFQRARRAEAFKTFVHRLEAATSDEFQENDRGVRGDKTKFFQNNANREFDTGAEQSPRQADSHSEHALRTLVRSAVDRFVAVLVPSKDFGSIAVRAALNNARAAASLKTSVELPNGLPLSTHNLELTLGGKGKDRTLQVWMPGGVNETAKSLRFNLRIERVRGDFVPTAVNVRNLAPGMYSKARCSDYNDNDHWTITLSLVESDS